LNSESSKLGGNRCWLKSIKKWACPASATGEALAAAVRKYHLPDFSNWKNHDAFARAFARLQKDLRMSLGK
jgi:hypothetical protein